MESNVNEPKPLSSQELDAFVSGLSFYLSSELPEPEKMSIGQAIVKDKMDNPEQLDFYQLFDEYKQQGHSGEEAEEMAWKVILGRMGSLEADESFDDWEILEIC